MNHATVNTLISLINKPIKLLSKSESLSPLRLPKFFDLYVEKTLQEIE